MKIIAPFSWFVLVVGWISPVFPAIDGGRAVERITLLPIVILPVLAPDKLPHTVFPLDRRTAILDTWSIEYQRRVSVESMSTREHRPDQHRPRSGLTSHCFLNIPSENLISTRMRTSTNQSVVWQWDWSSSTAHRRVQRQQSDWVIAHRTNTCFSIHPPSLQQYPTRGTVLAVAKSNEHSVDKCRIWHPPCPEAGEWTSASVSRRWSCAEWKIDLLWYTSLPVNILLSDSRRKALSIVPGHSLDWGKCSDFRWARWSRKNVERLVRWLVLYASANSPSRSAVGMALCSDWGSVSVLLSTDGDPTRRSTIGHRHSPAHECKRCRPQRILVNRMQRKNWWSTVKYRWGIPLSMVVEHRCSPTDTFRHEWHWLVLFQRSLTTLCKSIDVLWSHNDRWRSDRLNWCWY